MGTISITNVSKTFPARTGDSVTALANVDLAIEDGEFVALVGPSGCGKTTLLYMIAGIETCTAGSIQVDGRYVAGPGRDRGVVFQDYALFPWLTVRGNIAFGLEAHGVERSRREAVTQRYVDLVGLKGFEDKYPHELSGGMRQRCSLARTLANDPSVLLMDEPLAALDSQTRTLLQDEILRIWKSEEQQGRVRTVVFVTHSIEEAAYMADRIVVMTARPGRIKAALTNPLPRPRVEEMRQWQQYVELTGHLWKLVKAEVTIE